MAFHWAAPFTSILVLIPAIKIMYVDRDVENAVISSGADIQGQSIATLLIAQKADHISTAISIILGAALHEGWTNRKVFTSER